MPEEIGERSALGEAAGAISTSVVRLMHEYTGRGPTKARTTIRDDLVVVVLKDTMLKAEKSLADAGKAETVLHMRKEFQRAMREDLVAAVEMVMERKVAAFMSDNHIDPDVAVEIFILEPEATED
jgi:uncharacterized protein YbcI